MSHKRYRDDRNEASESEREHKREREYNRESSLGFSRREKAKTKEHRNQDKDRRTQTRTSALDQKGNRHMSDEEDEDLFVLSSHSSEKYTQRLRDLWGLDERHPVPTPIDSRDYFKKMTQFKVWLRRRPSPLYVDEMSSRRSKQYFKKFAMEWNRAKLDRKFYYEEMDVDARELTRYKWHIKDSENDKGKSISTGSGVGPSLDDIRVQMETREDEYERKEHKRRMERRKENREIKEELDEIAPKATGNEARIEKRRLANNQSRELREKEDQGGLLEFGDSILMGGDDFNARLTAQKVASERREERRAVYRAERMAELNERVSARKEKEEQTMAMLKELAAQKYGSG